MKHTKYRVIENMSQIIPTYKIFITIALYFGTDPSLNGSYLSKIANINKFNLNINLKLN